MELRHRKPTVTQYTEETSLDLSSCPQESACPTIAHTLAHQEVRSTETALQDLRRMGQQPPTRTRRTLSILYDLSFPCLCVSRITYH
ncbi:Protein CBG01393 [Caenorhabditis briggsae]|uniref:Protein CBG01393 n=1 Tax=Caenorhabditis briggsae TaxID=6238 RepID=A8WQB2_CAEBR|nr:Protein CBG01393 [Caenorhabditis briggsae]CAP22670.1 Protein CBG01393 [Caenorhabditis briggsae]